MMQSIEHNPSRRDKVAAQFALDLGMDESAWLAVIAACESERDLTVVSLMAVVTNCYHDHIADAISERLCSVAGSEVAA